MLLFPFFLREHWQNKVVVGIMKKTSARELLALGKFLRSPLFWLTTSNVIVVNGFALFYSLSLGPDRRAFLATVFALTLILHTLFLGAPGLRLRNSIVGAPEVNSNFRVMIFSSTISILVFPLILAAYSFFKNEIPPSLYFIGVFYYMSSVVIFLTSDSLLHVQNYSRLVINEILALVVLPLSFLCAFYLLNFSLAVSVLFAFSLTYVIIGVSSFKIIFKNLQYPKTKNIFKTSWLKSLILLVQSIYFRLILFVSSLERVDKVILAFLLDPALFAKFTFNIAPYITLRYIPQLVTRLTIAKKPKTFWRHSSYLIVFTVSLSLGLLMSFFINGIIKTLQGGVWFIGLTPVLAFILFESVRVVYSLMQAADIAKLNPFRHDLVSKVGIFLYPSIFLICLILSDNLAIPYIVSSIFLIAATVWTQYPMKR